MIKQNLNELNNAQLIAFVEQSIIQYHEQKAMSATHTMQVYGGISGRDLQVMDKALDRCLWNNPESIQTKQKVSEILANDFSIGIIVPDKKIKSLYEMEVEKNQMSMSRHHDATTVNRNLFPS